MNILDTLIKPIVTEKSETLRDTNNVYTFEVALKANKPMIKEAIKKIYGHKPIKVNIVTQKRKRKRNRYGYGYTSLKKKAYVYLATKDKIESHKV